MPFGRELHFDKVGLKTLSPNNQIRASGLEFSPAYAVQASFATFVSKQVGREYPGNRRESARKGFIYWFVFGGFACPGMTKQKCGTVSQNKNAQISDQDLGSGGISRVRQKLGQNALGLKF